MNLVTKAFDEGVKAAIKIFKNKAFSAEGVANGMDAVRKALEKAAKAAAKATVRKAAKG